jgi:hypothetical protein
MEKYRTDQVGKIVPALQFSWANNVTPSIIKLF